MGYEFPDGAVNGWWVSEGQVSQRFDDGSWLNMEITKTNLQPKELAIRLSVDSVERRLKPDELPPIEPLEPDASSSDAEQ